MLMPYEKKIFDIIVIIVSTVDIFIISTVDIFMHMVKKFRQAAKLEQYDYFKLKSEKNCRQH